MWPKNKKKSLCDSDNYRPIALSSTIGETLDWVIVIKEWHILTSSNWQSGFKTGLSTSLCTFCMNETINYYNYNRSNVYVLFLDAYKAFDRGQYFINYAREECHHL